MVKMLQYKLVNMWNISVPECDHEFSVSGIFERFCAIPIVQKDVVIQGIDIFHKATAELEKVTVSVVGITGADYLTQWCTPKLEGEKKDKEKY